jgi:hypothetical protein
VEKRGTYFYWFDYTDGLGNKRVTQPVKFKGTSTELDTSVLGSTYKQAKLIVMNKKTGNMAIVDFPPPKDQKAPKTIEIKDDSFSYVRAVRIRVVAEDKLPIESGLVEITDGEGTPMSAIVTPADNGVATFQNVAAGEINVKVRAKGVTKTIDSDIELPTKRDKPWFEREIRVKGDVDTIPAEATATSETRALEKKASSRASEHGRRIDMALQALAGIIFLVLIFAIIYAIARSKGVTVEGALRKLGVQLPESQTGAPGSVLTAGSQSPPTIDQDMCPFCGQKKDALGNCACSLQPATAKPVATGVPRLVGISGLYAGQVFDLGTGSKLIGRDAGCDVALVNDNTVSRRHATFAISADTYLIRDEGSSNGTFVNGVRVTETKLNPGDEIQIGATRFRFEA